MLRKMYMFSMHYTFYYIRILKCQTKTVEIYGADDI
jgi:hypothetical protein